MMRRRFFRASIAATVAVALFAGTTSAAFAYPPTDAVHTSTTSLHPGETLELSVDDGVFTSGEPLTITIRGEHATGVIVGSVRAGIETATHAQARANIEGGLAPLPIRFPSDAAGAYTIAVFSPSSPGGTITVTVGDLTVTGVNAQTLLGLWVGGGALVLAGVVVLGAALVARRRREADAA